MWRATLVGAVLLISLMVSSAIALDKWFVVQDKSGVCKIVKLMTAPPMAINAPIVVPKVDPKKWRPIDRNIKPLAGPFENRAEAERARITTCPAQGK